MNTDYLNFLRALSILSNYYESYERQCKKCYKVFSEQRTIRGDSNTHLSRFFNSDIYQRNEYNWCLACIQTELLLPSHD